MCVLAVGILVRTTSITVAAHMLRQWHQQMKRDSWPDHLQHQNKSWNANQRHPAVTRWAQEYRSEHYMCSKLKCSEVKRINIKRKYTEKTWHSDWEDSEESHLSFSWVLPGDEQRNHRAILLTLLFHVLQDVWDKQQQTFLLTYLLWAK